MSEEVIGGGRSSWASSNKEGGPMMPGHLNRRQQSLSGGTGEQNDYEELPELDS